MSVEGTTGLRRDTIGVAHIVFFVVAAAAPLTVVVGVTPAAFAYGNGAGVPGTYLMAGLLYLAFSVGYGAMSRHVGNAGGFYTFILRGLGRTIGVAAAYVAVATYGGLIAGTYGLFGFFANDIVKRYGGPDVHWFVYGTLLAVAVLACGVRAIEFSGRLLGACMLAEIVILALFGAAVLMGGGGPEGISLVPFEPARVLAPGLGAALVFVITSFIGFEATAIFGEEARDPERTISRATYCAVLLIAVFYAFSTWAIALHYGPSRISEAARAGTATLFSDAIEARLGLVFGVATSLLLLTSAFACILSFHNTINRYLYAMAREGLAWSRLSRTHPVHQSPYVAGLYSTLATWALAAGFAATGQDPYGVLFAFMGALASIGVLVLQVLVCFAVIRFFWTDHRGVGFVARLAAPAASAVGLAACLALMEMNLTLVAGSDSQSIQILPATIVASGILGAVMATHLRKRAPGLYAALGSRSAASDWRAPGPAAVR